MGSLIAEFRKGKGQGVTTMVSADEPCFSLTEADLPSPNGEGKTRYQLLQVVRMDQLVTAYVPMGSSADYHADGFNMLGGVIDESGKGQAYHTVGELRDGADELRSRPLHRSQAMPDLQTMFRNTVEEKKKLARHSSTFATGGNLVRP
mgnify:CR=1 FL=1